MLCPRHFPLDTISLCGVATNIQITRARSGEARSADAAARHSKFNFPLNVPISQHATDNWKWCGGVWHRQVDQATKSRRASPDWAPGTSQQELPGTSMYDKIESPSNAGEAGVSLGLGPVKYIWNQGTKRTDEEQEDLGRTHSTRVLAQQMPVCRVLENRGEVKPLPPVATARPWAHVTSLKLNVESEQSSSPQQNACASAPSPEQLTFFQAHPIVSGVLGCRVLECHGDVKPLSPVASSRPPAHSLKLNAGFEQPATPIPEHPTFLQAQPMLPSHCLDSSASELHSSMNQFPKSPRVIVARPGGAPASVPVVVVSLPTKWKNAHIKTIVYGTIAHAPRFGHVEVLEDAVVMVEKTGKVLLVATQDVEEERDILTWVQRFSAGTCTPVIQTESDRANTGGHMDMIRLARGQVLLPGFIDTHIHAAQYSYSGTATDRPLMEWLNHYTFPAERRLADERIAARVYSAVVERTLRGGTTTALYYATIHVPATKILADIAMHKGQRAFIGKVCMDRNSPSDYSETTAEALAGTEAFIQVFSASTLGLLLKTLSCLSHPSVCLLPFLLQLWGTHVPAHKDGV